MDPVNLAFSIPHIVKNFIKFKKRHRPLIQYNHNARLNKANNNLHLPVYINDYSQSDNL